jgi:hypothetical protein
MAAPEINARRIGAERRAVAVVDGFHPGPEGLRAFALAQTFAPARNHYPGLRAPLPENYFPQVRPALTTVLRDVFGARTSPKLIDASFSVVTTPSDALSLEQRLPHFDALQPDRVALVHYLSTAPGGTAFFRHRTTGFEAIDEGRSSAYFDALNADLEREAAPTGYIGDSDALFDRIALVEARLNRAAIYASAMLHSGVIDAAPDPDPATGRLTVTAFLSIAG